MSKKSVGSLVAVADALGAARRLVLTTHVRMDPDAIGSVVALHRWAVGVGKDSRIVLLDAVPRRCAYLLADQSLLSADEFASAAANADRIVVVDTCALTQLEPIAEQLGALRDKIVVIDHHATADDVGALIWADVSAAAAGVMVAELLEELNWQPDGPAVEALATAILADTGWFRHANTDERALRTVAELVAAGANLNTVYRRIYQSDRPQRIRLLAAALGSLELHAGGRLAIMALGPEDFAAAGAGQDETEDFVNEPLRIAAVEISVIVIAAGNGLARVSLRSRGAVDVAALAKSFGGGGHTRAAGFTAGGDPQSVRQRLLAACSQALAEADK